MTIGCLSEQDFHLYCIFQTFKPKCIQAILLPCPFSTLNKCGKSPFKLPGALKNHLQTAHKITPAVAQLATDKLKYEATKAAQQGEYVTKEICRHIVALYSNLGCPFDLSNPEANGPMFHENSTNEISDDQCNELLEMAENPFANDEQDSFSMSSNLQPLDLPNEQSSSNAPTIHHSSPNDNQDNPTNSVVPITTVEQCLKSPNKKPTGSRPKCFQCEKKCAELQERPSFEKQDIVLILDLESFTCCLLVPESN